MKLAYLLLLCAISLKCLAQFTESRHSEEMSGDERETLYERKKAARAAEQSVEDWRAQIKANHGQSDHRNVDIYEAEGYVVITEKSAEN